MKATKDVSRFDYLRHRPFLTVTRNFVPNSRSRTERKGWMDNEDNVTIDETPNIVYHVNDRVLRSASVIIDIKNDVLVKNFFKSATVINLIDEISEHQEKARTIKNQMKKIKDI